MKINGHEFSLGNALTVISMAGGLIVVWTNLNADNADTKRRLTTLETRQAEDRREARIEQKEIKADVKETKETVNKILIKLESQEARRGR